MTIQEHISSLLYRFDCVIIPGFGGFVANYSPAQLLTGQNLAFPPSKGLIFNKNLLNNDGLLADAIAQEEQIGYAEAVLKIEKFVEEIRHTLHEGGRIEIQDIGFLYYDDEKNIQFKPGFAANFLVDSFGLYPVMAKEIVLLKNVAEEKEVKILQPETIVKKDNHVSVPEKELHHNTSDEKVISINRPGNVKRYWPVAAALIPLAFYSLWIPLKTDAIKTGHIELADFNPFRSNYSYYEPRELPLEEKTEAPQNEWIEITSKAGGPVAKLEIGENSHLNIYVIENPKPVAETTQVVKPIQSRRSKNLHIIGGCFREKSNADKLVAELQEKGYQSYILDETNGLHRVAIESFDNKTEASAMLSKLRSGDQPAAWLLEK